MINMKVYFEKNNETKEINFSGKLKEIIDKYNLIEDEIVIIKNDEIVTSDEIASNEDKIKILNVVSGG